MSRHDLGQMFCKVRMSRVETQEGDHGALEILNVLRLGFVSPSSIGGFFLREAFGQPRGFEFSTNPFDSRRRCPNAFGKDLPSLPLGDDPVIPRRLHATGQCGITGGE